MTSDNYDKNFSFIYFNTFIRFIIFIFQIISWLNI